MILGLIQLFFLVCTAIVSTIFLIIIGIVPSFRKALIARWVICTVLLLHLHIICWVTGMTDGELEKKISLDDGWILPSDDAWALLGGIIFIGVSIYTIWIAVDYPKKQAALTAKQQKVNTSNAVLQYGDPIITDDEIESKDK